MLEEVPHGLEPGGESPKGQALAEEPVISSRSSSLLAHMRACEAPAPYSLRLWKRGMYVPCKRTFTKASLDAFRMGLQLLQTWGCMLQCGQRRHRYQQELTPEHKRTEAGKRQQPPSRFSKLRLGRFIAIVHFQSKPSRAATREIGTDGTDQLGGYPHPCS